MNNTIEALWNEYLLDECNMISTEEERRLIKRSYELREKISASLNEEQEQALEGYVDALCDIEALSVKKAFFKGCKFAFSFFLEVGIDEK